MDREIHEDFEEAGKNNLESDLFGELSDFEDELLRKYTLHICMVWSLNGFLSASLSHSSSLLCTLIDDKGTESLQCESACAYLSADFG